MRLIDADALKRGCIRLPRILDDEFVIHVKLTDVIKSINNAPTVDAVEVVRCRNCKHGSQYDDGSDNYVCRIGGTKKGSDFCINGERMKEDAD